MKCQIIVDPHREEEVLIYVHEKNPISEEIEKFVFGWERELLGYSDKDIVKLHPSEICCFTVREHKVFAVTDTETLQIRQRLYMLEDMLDEDFVMINQSCIANMKKIKKFEVSFGGSLMVIFQNGYRDYVSRRKLKIVKERMGIAK